MSVKKIHKISRRSVQWQPSHPCGRTDGTNMTKLPVLFVILLQTRLEWRI